VIEKSTTGELDIPELSLVVLIGASGCGKSTFAARHFLPTEVLSSDRCRGLVSNDENDQAATQDAFAILHFIAAKRMAAGRLTVVDATNVKREDRARLIKLAREHHFLPVAIVFDLPEQLCRERNSARPDRQFGDHVIRNQIRDLRRGRRGLRKEGFRTLHVLDSPESVDGASIKRTRLWNDHKHEHGPFDVIGDVHGCADELERLLDALGYESAREEPGAFPDGGPTYTHPAGRTAVFVGDLVDRGPRVLDSVRIVRNMVIAGSGRCVPGNHDVKLVRKLRGRDVQITHGLDRTLAEIEALPDEQRERAAAELIAFLDGLISHHVYDDGKLVVAHAGLRQEMQGRGSGKVRDFALYGETTGETDEFGLPVRWDWAAEYRGPAAVVYGHTPVPDAEWLNGTINIDTGCVFGGRLTALRYPEREIVSVPAAATYAEPARPFLAEDEIAPALTAQQREDEMLDIEDVLGKRIVSTRLGRGVTIREENAIAALEVMGRFAINPKWLIYLPPTVSPSATTSAAGLLEHPAEAFAYFKGEGVPRVICEEKHMGSRAIVVVCTDEDAARRTFGVIDEGIGACYTRTGRRFLNDSELERQLLTRVREAAAEAGIFERLDSDWLLLDCELMPWSAKAQELLSDQYAAVGSAARAGLGATLSALERATANGIDTGAILDRFGASDANAQRFIDAYRRYCWPVSSIDDLKLAPFHLLASAGAVHVDKDHLWHMRTLADICVGEPLLQGTSHIVVDTTDADSEAAALAWWTELTDGGGEGMVVKPLDHVVRGRRGLVQPALKTRGREYLRIIYGPDYTEPANLERLRVRSLGRKRGLAAREFALGVEALERFVRGEPLRRVHECVFGVLALESEPVDPRL
jgi:protein phosphatase